MHMLAVIITFLLLAILSAMLGLTGLAGTFASAAQFLAGFFIILFFGTLIYSLIIGRDVNPPM